MVQLSIGDTLAGYRVEGLAGRGGMGVVYKATQLALDRPVALKLIAPALAEDESFRERFKRESRTAAQIEHAHVIPVHEAGEADGQLFIAMRLIDGVDLREIIQRHGRIDPARAVRLIAQIASALDAAHARGLVHRDIKPGNVLIATEGGRDHAYLTDFGLSKQLGSESGVTGTGVFVGTVDYIAPEQIQGLPLDARSDVYSLGCLLYHALTGHVPFERDSDVAKIFAHMSEPPPPLHEAATGLPPALDAVLIRSMAKEPADRYPSAGDLGRAALAAVEGRYVSEPERSVAVGAAAPAPATRVKQRPGAPTTAATTATGPDRHRPLLVALLGLAALAAVIVAVVAVLFGGGGDDDGGDPAGSAFSDGAVTITPLKVDSPGGVALGAGGLWATSYESDTLTRVDFESAEIGEPIAVGDGPTGVTVGDGSVWVVNNDAGSVSRVDVERGEVVGTPIELPSTVDGDSIAAGNGKVWVAAPSEGQVVTIDPEAGKAGQTLDPPDGTMGEIAFGEGGLWVVGDTGTVTRLDPGSGAAGEPVKVGSKLSDDIFRGEIAVGEGAVWVAGLDDETVTRVDPGSGDVVETIKFPEGIEGDLAVGNGSVWALNENAQLIRIDPKTNDVQGSPLPAGTAGANDFTAGEGAVWLAGNLETDTVTRVAP